MFNKLDTRINQILISYQDSNEREKKLNELKEKFENIFKSEEYKIENNKSELFKKTEKESFDRYKKYCINTIETTINQIKQIETVGEINVMGSPKNDEMNKPKREKIINNDDITNLKIDLNNAHNVDEFIDLI